MKRMIGTLALFLVAILAVPAFARDGHGKGEGKDGEGCGKDDAGHHEKMKGMRDKMLREKVGLTDEKAKQVEAILDANQARHVELGKAFKEALGTLKQLAKADSNDQEAYKKALETLRINFQARQTLMDEQMEALKKILSPKEQAKMFLAHERMKRKMGKWKKGKDGGHGGPDGPDGPNGPDDDGPMGE